MKTPSLGIIVAATLAMSAVMNVACGTAMPNPSAPAEVGANAASPRTSKSVPTPEAARTASAAGTAAALITPTLTAVQHSSTAEAEARDIEATNQKLKQKCFGAVGGWGYNLYERGENGLPVAIKDLSKLDVTDHFRTVEIEEPRTNWVHLGGYPREWRLLEFGSPEWEASKLSGLTNMPALDYCPDYLDDQLSKFDPKRPSTQELTNWCHSNSEAGGKWRNDLLSPDEPIDVGVEDFPFIITQRWCETASKELFDHQREERDPQYPTPIPAK